MTAFLKPVLASILLCSCVATDLSTMSAKKPIDSSLKLSTTKLNSGNEIFRAPSSSADCGYYLINLGGWKVTTYTVNDKVYFTVPCKTSDAGSGGWHYGKMYWGIGNLSTTWIDGDIGQAGEQPLLSKSDIDSNGFAIGSFFGLEVTFNGTNYAGLIKKYYNSANYGGTSGYYWSPVSFNTPESFSATDIDVNNRGLIHDAENDSSWKGKSLNEIELEYSAGTYYLYKTNINAPTNSTYYIVLQKTTDLISFTSPTSYLLKDYRDPHVFKYSDKVYMIAYSTIKNGWMLIPGDNYESFDTSKEVKIEIGSKMYGKGDWDDTPLYTDFQNYEPNLAGVELVNSKIYIFYMAGGFGQLSGDPNSGAPYNGVPYNGARGIGVMELEIK